ncbi:MAG TPA: hypothetical protein VNJ04_18805, partial [Gemmatimonadaceae bacterium]|nr:hypothetical protein [Gemmatimonadaceae bacterium]
MLIADWFIRTLVPFLIVTSFLLLGLLLLLLVQRVVARVRLERRQKLIDRYQPSVTALFIAGQRDAAVARLAAAPVSHRRAIGYVLLRPLRVAGGEIVEAIREAAAALDLNTLWTTDLR